MTPAESPRASDPRPARADGAIPKGVVPPRLVFQPSCNRIVDDMSNPGEQSDGGEK